MTTHFDSNTFEHDYIVLVLQEFICELETDRSESQVLDKYAVEITAFMVGYTRCAVLRHNGETA